MSAVRVLILSSQLLFAESLKGLLEQQGCEVIAVTPYDDSVRGLVATAQPDVVVLDVQASPSSATATLLECAANIRVVHVSLDSQVIAFYDRRESSATVHDFLELLTSTHAGGAQRDGESETSNTFESEKF